LGGVSRRGQRRVEQGIAEPPEKRIAKWRHEGGEEVAGPHGKLNRAAWAWDKYGKEEHKRSQKRLFQRS